MKFWHELQRLQAVACVALFVALPVGQGLAQGIAGALLGIALLQTLTSGGRERMLGVLRTPAVACVLAFCAWALVDTLLFSSWPSKGLGRLFDYIAMASVAVTISVHGERLLERSLTAFSVTLALVSLYAIAQHYYGLTWFAELGSPRERWQTPAPTDHTLFVASGFFYNRLKFTHVLLAGLPLAASLAYARYGKERLAFAVGAALMTLALLFTYARAAVIALALAALIVLGLHGWRRGVLWLSAALSAVAGLAAAIPSVRGRMLSLLEGKTYDERLFLWSRALEIIREHPWVGSGWGTYERVCGTFYDRVDPTFVMRTQAHQQWLTFLAETGPIGVLLFAALWVTLLQLIHRSSAPHAWAVQTFFVAIAIEGLSHDPFFQPIVTLTFFSFAGLYAARPQRA